ncbi:nuclear transport factor 2 family protein [Comamonas sp. UBA7528]|uniref:nuclear transport factor 2 family protein n=1 Tax=Comamonas sp. UBA7528 TaxID=1946391 RepID=UPI0025B9D9AA|nr:nuclear transport factor 2 family protein [Comamonas sp. UBA7528]
MSANSPDSLADMGAAVQRLVQLYETLTPANIQQLGACYAADAHFKDPFNDVSGVPAITRIFEHMFVSLQDPRFVVTQKLVQGQQAFLAWEFHFRLRRWRPDTAQCINGATLLTLDAQGRVSMHRDYWDTAEELYVKLPLLGGLMRWLRAAGSASGSTIDADRSPP